MSQLSTLPNRSALSSGNKLPHTVSFMNSQLNMLPYKTHTVFRSTSLKVQGSVTSVEISLAHAHIPSTLIIICLETGGCWCGTAAAGRAAFFFLYWGFERTKDPFYNELRKNVELSGKSRFTSPLLGLQGFRDTCKTISKNYTWLKWDLRRLVNKIGIL